MNTDKVSHYDENGNKLVDMPGNNSGAVKRTFEHEQKKLLKRSSKWK